MEALKKAYAEIILNMAKEAAARVMVSEQKALKFQQDLHSTKEEALRMLLRLKSMIDAKTTEAERLSQNKQRRIDELEAQLNEAEGMIIDLRAELYNVREQLNEEKNKHLHYLRPHVKEDLVCRKSIQSKLNNFESLNFPTELGSNVCKSALMSDIALCNYSTDNHILAAEIVKSNEPEIYQNGYCSIEMSLADERLHSGDDPSFPIEVTQVTEPSGRDAGAHNVPVTKAKKIENLVGEKPLKGLSSKQRPYTFRGKRRRKAQYGKTKNSSCKVRCNKLMLSQRPLTTISRSARYLHAGAYYDSPDSPSTNTERENAAGSSFLLGKREPRNKDLTIAVARRSIRKRRVKYLDNSFPASLSHSSHSNHLTRPGQQCPSFSHSKCNAVECTMKSTKLTNEGDIEEGAGFLTDNKICRESASADSNDDKELIDVSVIVEEGDDKSLLDVTMLPVESIFGDDKASEGSKESPVQGNNKTPLRFTFSRKRKKDSLLNPNENPSPVSSMKKRSAEIENTDPRLKDSKPLKDSPLRSKQLVQVARQLVSLSGRSWW
ncbi:PREDICTED: uncharacterized protein LOC109206804 [Nicotiana attenuata]|uniref:Uncharacterized protein n=1 Tax=Nicotiana attenuata TaxID=49451 RepID=A0A1J6IZD4_NICAT|nr:PREDICTED: uncharacterized protein LOC109206804 [Nicotiana attenuata]OIT05896.1 hypothetical protein A4A49_12613 [Nicotiana attenuata]